MRQILAHGLFLTLRCRLQANIMTLLYPRALISSAIHFTVAAG